LLGVASVAVSKLLKFDQNPLGLSDGVREFGIDIAFEIGVALIGAAVTAYPPASTSSRPRHISAVTPHNFDLARARSAR